MNSEKSTAVMVLLQNTKGRLLPSVVVFALILVGMMIIAVPSAALAASKCPSGGTPAPGSTVNGGIDVDGTCVLDNVTVNGGITVDATGHLEFITGTVNGGIVVLPCGEVDVNATTNGSGTPTGTTATINGGLLINGITATTICPLFSLPDADIRTALIDGGLSVTGMFPRASPLICENDIRGGVTLTDVSTPFRFFLGDDDNDAPIRCLGNVIHGTVSVSNSTNLEVEFNAIGGSVLLSGSILELEGNTIQGSLRCTDGTVLLPADSGSPNTIHGANHCP
jgi:hypothetical protein